jgi:hypothetical protein
LCLHVAREEPKRKQDQNKAQHGFLLCFVGRKWERGGENS